MSCIHEGLPNRYNSNGQLCRELLPTNGMVGCMITSIYGAVNAFLEWTTHDGDMEKGAVLRVHSGFPSGLL